MEEKTPPASAAAQELSDLETSFTSSSAAFSGSSARSSLTGSFSFSSANSSAAAMPLPHRRTDPHWSAVLTAGDGGSLHLRNLSLLGLLGSGNLARVFHCRLRNSSGGADFALKVVDLDAAGAGREAHVAAEATVLAELDHPFLPTLYARLDASHYACFLIDYCSGGSLHDLLRHRRRLRPASARFYAAEVLLAVEYLHALGFVYRDLKPENVLLRSDGHVMLSDFDLCFRSDVSPAILRKGEDEDEVMEFVAEPEGALSRACVGTHEYLAPEMVAGDGHGGGVDWWAFGVFIYEMMYGRTPFKGKTKEETLRNIAAAEFRFPAAAERGEGGEEVMEKAARDLIRRLLVKDPKRRMGCRYGAAEIKRHPFFDGIKWALIRNCRPPEMVAAAVPAPERKKKRWWRWVRERVVGGIRSKMGFGASSPSSVSGWLRDHRISKSSLIKKN